MKIVGKTIDIIKDKDLILSTIYSGKKITIDQEKEKKYLVQLLDKIPMYDIKTDSVYFLDYDKLYHYHIKENYHLYIPPFLDKKKLEQKFIEKMYKHSSYLGKNMTNCVKAIYSDKLPIENPYYTKQEIINQAFNMGIIDSFEGAKIDDLCKTISQYDINSSELQEHNNYIMSSEKQSFVRNYSLFDAYFINGSIRKNLLNDSILNQKIYHFERLLLKAPPFEKERFVYRFIREDSYLSSLQVGDIYTTDSFISSSRNPFYNSDTDYFGYILLKIKLPKQETGVALCIENYSLFPREEEVIIAPFIKFKLVSLNNDFNYYHYNFKTKSKVVRKYEFEYIGKEGNTIFNKTPKIKIDEIPEINFERIPSDKDKIKYFLENYCNLQSQFRLKLRNKYLFFCCNFYDSSASSAYTNFFSFKVSKGFMIYNFDIETLANNYVFEIADGRMAVNYYNKFTPFNKVLEEKDFIELVTYISNIFSIYHIIIYPEFRPCSTIKKSIVNDVYLYNVDLHNYITGGKVLYKNPNIKCHYNFDILQELGTPFLKDYPELRFLYKDGDTIKKFYLNILNDHPNLLKTFYKAFDGDDFYYTLDTSNILIYNNFEITRDIDSMEHTRNQRI